jgi:hypothetical protein
MVVSIVLKVSVPNDLTIEQFKEKLEKRLEVLKPDKVSAFQVQGLVYSPNVQSNMPSLSQVLHSDYPATCFSVIEQSDYKVLTGDIGLASVQRRLSELGVLTDRKQLHMESIGSSFKLGDFQIKIGAVTHGSSNRGLIIEVTYLCGSTYYDSYGLLSEFILSIFGWNIQEKGVDMLANIVRRKPHSSLYQPEDTILQYYEHFNFFRSSVTQKI